MTSQPATVGRIRATTADTLSPEQRPLWDSITAGPRGAAPWMVTNGVLAGPFNAWLQIPHIGGPLAAAGEQLRFQSSLHPVLREAVILTVGAHWRSEFEFWAHANIGRDEGMAESLIDAIEAQSISAVADATDDESVRLAHRATLALVRTGVVPEPEFTSLCETIGEASTLEMIALAGYYTVVSFTLNSAQVPLPAGIEPRFN